MRQSRRINFYLPNDSDIDLLVNNLLNDLDLDKETAMCKVLYNHMIRRYAGSVNSLMTNYYESYLEIENDLDLGEFRHKFSCVNLDIAKFVDTKYENGDAASHIITDEGEYIIVINDEDEGPLTDYIP